MISLELLAELVAFEKYGTLSATAEHLMLTQPSVTRGMKKLESELGVPLFDRKANKISLNATGKLAAKKASDLLQAEHDFTETIINFSHSQNSISIGSTLPGTLLLIDDLQKQTSNIMINHQLIAAKDVQVDLNNYTEKLIFTTTEIFTQTIESMYLGTEQLAVKIDPFNPLSTKKSVTFKELANQSFLAITEIGPWRKILEDNIPNAKFLYQENAAALNELSRHSNFPYFVSNLSQQIHNDPSDSRVLVPIIDDANKLEIFGSYLISQRLKLITELKLIAKNWPKYQ